MNLTDEAKETAKHLADFWQKNLINQQFELVDVTAGSGVTERKYVAGMGINSKDFIVPKSGTLYELANRNLIH